MQDKRHWSERPLRKRTDDRPRDERPLYAPPPPSPQEIDRERERREAVAEPKPERGAALVDFYV